MYPLEHLGHSRQDVAAPALAGLGNPDACQRQVDIFSTVQHGILAGQAWARVTGVVLAVISALVNLAFMAAFPLWATLIIALDVLVIYALVAHGKEITA